MYFISLLDSGPGKGVIREDAMGAITLVDFWKVKLHPPSWGANNAE